MKMKKKALYIDIFKQISKTKGRFISIILLLTVGIFAYTGLQAAGPYMQDNVLKYYDDYDLADIVIQSTYGLDEDDISQLNNVEQMETIEYGYTKDTFINNEINTKILSKTTNISSSEVIEGRLPEKSGEIALDEKVFKDKYQIGDKVSFFKEEKIDKENVKQDTYEIVGYIRNAEFVNILDRGNSSIGDGKAKAFGIILPEDFDMDVYTIARVKVAGLEGQRYDLDPYEKSVKSVIKNIEEQLKDRPDIRLSDIKKEANEKIQEAQEEIQDAKEKLAEAQEELTDAKKQIDNGYSEYTKNEKKIQDAESLLLESESKLKQTEKTIQESGKVINENKAKLAKTLKELETSKVQVSQAMDSVNDGIKSIEQAIATIGETPELVSQLQALTLKKQELQEQYKKIEAGYVEYQAYKKEFDIQEGKFLEGQRQLKEGKQKYNSSRAEITKGKAELAKAKTKLNDANKKYEDGKKEFEDKKQEANQKIADAQKELDDNKEKIENLKNQSI